MLTPKGKKGKSLRRGVSGRGGKEEERRGKGGLVARARCSLKSNMQNVAWAKGGGEGEGEVKKEKGASHTVLTFTHNGKKEKKVDAYRPSGFTGPERGGGKHDPPRRRGGKMTLAEMIRREGA